MSQNRCEEGALQSSLGRPSIATFACRVLCFALVFGDLDWRHRICIEAQVADVRRLRSWFLLRCRC